jgi:pyruvate carboxylase
VYKHEIPGGQYSNLKPQAVSLGLGNKMEEIKKAYEDVNNLFGDIVKVTPSSKVVGDMALYMVTNNLSNEEVFTKGQTLSFPDSVKSMFRGDLGQPPGGFPKDLQKIILKDEKPYTDLPNAHIKPIDFDAEFEAFKNKFDDRLTFLDFLSYKFYPKVFEEYYKKIQQYGDLMALPTIPFFYGMKNNEEIIVDIGKGKTILIRLLYVGDADENGMRTVYFRLNGQTRTVDVLDKSQKSKKQSHLKASAENHIGAPLQGMLSKIFVKEGDVVKRNTPLFVIEAMKMETTITAPKDMTVKKIYLTEKTLVESDDLVVEG